MSNHDQSDEDLQKLLADVDNATNAPAATTKFRRAKKETGQRGRRTYRSGLSEGQTDRRKTAKATGKESIVAGQYLRRSFTFRPDQLDNIEKLAASLGLSQNDLVRWFVDMGVDVVEQGEHPPITEEVRHRYDPGGG